VTFTPNPTQREIIASSNPVLLVLGGAGTGKTTTAAAAARHHLEAGHRPAPTRFTPQDGAAPRRVLFLSFSRASVARIIERSGPLLGSSAGQVEVTTFHALAWSIIRRFGSLIDLPDPYLMTEAQAKLFAPDERVLRYSDLVPKALELLTTPAVQGHLKVRWSMIICDEYQDTDESQFELVNQVRGPGTRLLLLGDPNQCIYASLPGVVGVGPERLASALALPGARKVDLPEASYRDPSGVLPAAAAAIRRRTFDAPAIAVALASGRLEVRSELAPEDEAETVAGVVRELRDAGDSVAVFSHHNDALANLSDQLAELGIAHETSGLTESMSAAFDAILAMLKFSQGITPWKGVQQGLAVFVTSALRGRNVPPLARMLLGKAALPGGLVKRLTELELALPGSGLSDALDLAAAAHTNLGLPAKATSWNGAASQLRPMLARTDRGPGRKTPAAQLARLEAQLQEQRVGLLTEAYSEHEPDVQLMGLYQTKGREADSTVIILRSTDFFGMEKKEPYEEGSRLMYVVFTRARKRSIVLIFGSGLPGLVEPLARLSL
jgi:DNA helicase-2/ATP-dependent DNA helicase PcrA